MPRGGQGWSRAPPSLAAPATKALIWFSHTLKDALFVVSLSRIGWPVLLVSSKGEIISIHLLWLNGEGVECSELPSYIATSLCAVYCFAVCTTCLCRRPSYCDHKYCSIRVLSFFKNRDLHILIKMLSAQLISNIHPIEAKKTHERKKRDV